MAIVMLRIDMPPKGELETSSDGGAELTDDQMNEELAIREDFLERTARKFAELPRRPPHRMGNVSRVELIGGNERSRLNHYMVILTVDIGIPYGLAELLPEGAELTVLGPFEALQTWPEIVVPSQAAATA
jgi:hypothetical protein